METKDSNSQMQDLIALADEITKVLQKIKNQTDLNQKENAENGHYEFAYVKYYLAEMSSLLNFSALALPPFNPPNLPRATAAGFLIDSLAMFLGVDTPVACSTIWAAKTLRSRMFFSLRERFGIPHYCMT